MNGYSYIAYAVQKQIFSQSGLVYIYLTRFKRPFHETRTLDRSTISVTINDLTFVRYAKYNSWIIFVFSRHKTFNLSPKMAPLLR